MDGDHPFLSRCVVSFSFMVCSGHHVSLRLLSLLRVMNISPSQKKKKKKRSHPNSARNLKQSGGRSRFRMNPTQNSATCYSDNYDKELRSTESCSKVPVNVQRLQLCLVDIAWLGNLAGQGAVFFFCWEGEIFITRSNDNNLKEM